MAEQTGIDAVGCQNSSKISFARRRFVGLAGRRVPHRRCGVMREPQLAMPARFLVTDRRAGMMARSEHVIENGTRGGIGIHRRIAHSVTIRVNGDRMRDPGRDEVGDRLAGRGEVGGGGGVDERAGVKTALLGTVLFAMTVRAPRRAEASAASRASACSSRYDPPRSSAALAASHLPACISARLRSHDASTSGPAARNSVRTSRAALA